MKLNVVTLVIVTLALIAGAYWFLFMGAEDQSLLSVTDAQNPAQEQFQRLTSQLGPISFDSSIFSDPKFTSLVSLATPVTPEESGRLDPFAPLSGVVSGTAKK